MNRLHLLAATPFFGILGGIAFANRVEPYIFGVPFVLAWVVMWVVLASVIVATVYRLDPANGHVAPTMKESGQ